jgi:hypothetical protein
MALVPFTTVGKDAVTVRKSKGKTIYAPDPVSVVRAMTMPMINATATTIS